MKNPVEKYIQIIEGEAWETVGKKTKVWHILNIKSMPAQVIGHIRWYTGFRKYCFYPADDMLFDWNCMRMIANFCEERTQDHYAL